MTAGLHTHQPYIIVQKAIENTDGIAAAAHTGDDLIGQTASLLQNLPARLFADHTLKFAHHEWIRMRPQRTADDVVRVVRIGDPIAHGLVHGIFQRLGA